MQSNALLVRDGVTITKARRIVCWQELELLSHCRPRQNRDPEQLDLHLKRDQLTAASSCRPGSHRPRAVRIHTSRIRPYSSVRNPT